MGAALNDYYSICRLAWAYEYGKGCEVNIERALSLYEKVAEFKPDNEYITNKLQTLHTKVDLSEVYYVSNIADYKPFGDDKKRNFMYGVLFHIDSDTLSNIISRLNTCDKNKSTDKSEDFFKSVDIWWDTFDFSNNFSLDYDDNNENERAKEAKKLVKKLFEYDSDIIFSSMKWLRTRLDVLEKSSDNSSLRSYLQNIKDKYNSLIDDLSNDFGQNNTSLFSLFDDYSDKSERNPFWSAIIDSYNSEVNKYNKKIEEFESKDKKSSTRNTVGGMVAYGLLSLIPVVGLPIGIATGAGLISSGIGEVSEQEYKLALANEITNIHKIIYYGTVIAILDNVSDCIIDDIEEKVSFANHQSSNSFSDDSDDFFDEI